MRFIEIGMPFRLSDSPSRSCVGHWEAGEERSWSRDGFEARVGRCAGDGDPAGASTWIS